MQRNRIIPNPCAAAVSKKRGIGPGLFDSALDITAGYEMIEEEWVAETAYRPPKHPDSLPKAGEVRPEVTNGSSAVTITRDSLSMPAHLLPRFAFVEGGHLKTATVRSNPSVAQAAALERACLAARVAADNKGRDVLVLDMREVTPLYDYFVLATGGSRRQIHTMAEEIDAALRAEGDHRLNIEGYESSRWVVQDYGDVVVHLFDADARQYYALEELWADADRVDWELH